MRWVDPKYAKGTEKSTRGSGHTTVIYGSNTAVEVMPPIYCFDISSDNSDNFQVKSTWFQGIPKLSGKYGCPTNNTCDSSLYVSNIGYTDKELMQKSIEKCFTYPCILIFIFLYCAMIQVNLFVVQ